MTDKYPRTPIEERQKIETEQREILEERIAEKLANLQSKYSMMLDASSDTTALKTTYSKAIRKLLECSSEESKMNVRDLEELWDFDFFEMPAFWVLSISMYYKDSLKGNLHLEQIKSRERQDKWPWMGPLDSWLQNMAEMHAYLRLLRTLEDTPDIRPKNELNDQIEKIELALRELVHTTLGDQFVSVVPSHLHAEIQRTVRKHVNSTPSAEMSEYDSLKACLPFLDLRHLQDTICTKNNWQAFVKRFQTKELLSMRFNQLGDLRNAIRHSRPYSETVELDARAAIRWFKDALEL